MRSLLLLCVLALTAVSLTQAVARRGGVQQQMQQPEQQQQQQQQGQAGELVSFLQQHARARASQATNSAEEQAAPSLQAQQAAASTVPAGAQEANADNVLMALEHTPSHKHNNAHPTHSLIQHGAQVAAGAGSQVAAHARAAGDDGDGEDFGPCKTCVFVLERIKKGSNMLLPAICSELYHKYPDAYALCHQVLNALSINGNNVRYWLFEGCFKYEIYQSKEWIKPCPSHVMCSVLKDLSAEPFCPALPMENPFEDAE